MAKSIFLVDLYVGNGPGRNRMLGIVNEKIDRKNETNDDSNTNNFTVDTNYWNKNRRRVNENRMLSSFIFRTLLL